MDAKGPQIRASSVDLHVSELRARHVRTAGALRILFFAPAIRRCDGEIARRWYSVIIRRDGGLASWCRRLVTTVKPAAVDNQPTIDRVLRRALDVGVVALSPLAPSFLLRPELANDSRERDGRLRLYRSADSAVCVAGT